MCSLGSYLQSIFMCWKQTWKKKNSLGLYSNVREKEEAKKPLRIPQVCFRSANAFADAISIVQVHAWLLHAGTYRKRTWKSLASSSPFWSLMKINCRLHRGKSSFLEMVNQTFNKSLLGWVEIPFAENVSQSEEGRWKFRSYPFDQHYRFKKMTSLPSLTANEYKTRFMMYIGNCTYGAAALMRP